jgi:hypothetical protein
MADRMSMAGRRSIDFLEQFEASCDPTPDPGVVTGRIVSAATAASRPAIEVPASTRA